MNILNKFAVVLLLSIGIEMWLAGTSLAIFSGQWLAVAQLDGPVLAAGLACFAVLAGFFHLRAKPFTKAAKLTFLAQLALASALCAAANAAFPQTQQLRLDLAFVSAGSFLIGIGLILMRPPAPGLP